MTQKSYTLGSSFPALSDCLRLYSMRFCPYSQRVRLLLAIKNMEYETVNINIKKKPEWYIKIVPQGYVPAIEMLEGKILFESNIICEYLDEIYPGKKLFPTDPYEKAKSKMLIDTFQRIAALLFKGLKFKDKEAFNEINKVLDSFEKELIGDYFGGYEPNIIDIMIWPWFERFITLKSLTSYEIDKTRFPKITDWIERMLNIPAVKQTETYQDHMVEFYKTIVGNQEPNYDIGLE